MKHRIAAQTSRFHPSITQFFLSLPLSCCTPDCPFTGQCVGLSNFRAFYLFLCYGLLGISYACYMSYAPFKLCFLASFGVEAEEWQRTSGPLCEKVGE